jgi:hypothetical protein
VLLETVRNGRRANDEEVAPAEAATPSIPFRMLVEDELEVERDLSLGQLRDA